MTKSELHLPDTAFIGPGLLFLNQYFNSFINEYFVLWAALVSPLGTSLPDYHKRSEFFLNLTWEIFNV